MAPEHIEVVVAPRSFDRAGTAILGPIWLRHNARDAAPANFPETGWTDFPIRILAGWLTDLVRLASAGDDQATCHFMDGPFLFTATDAGHTLLRVRCVGHYLDGDQPVADFFASSDALYESVRAGAQAALAECDRRGWRDRDVEELRSALASFGDARRV